MLSLKRWKSQNGLSITTVRSRASISSHCIRLVLVMEVVFNKCQLRKQTEELELPAQAYALARHSTFRLWKAAMMIKRSLSCHFGQVCKTWRDPGHFPQGASLQLVILDASEISMPLICLYVVWVDSREYGWGLFIRTINLLTSMVVHALNPSIWQAETVDFCEFQSSLVYILSSRTARMT